MHTIDGKKRDKREKEVFDVMWGTFPDCTSQLVLILYTVGITSSYYHYVDSVTSLHKELKECISEVERIEARGRSARIMR